MHETFLKPYSCLFLLLSKHFLINSSRALPNVTGSVKTWHNRASLNFRFKALNTMGEILTYSKKYYGIFLNAWFVEKKTSNNKT